MHLCLSVLHNIVYWLYCYSTYIDALWWHKVRSIMATVRHLSSKYSDALNNRLKSSHNWTDTHMILIHNSVHQRSHTFGAHTQIRVGSMFSYRDSYKWRVSDLFGRRKIWSSQPRKLRIRANLQSSEFGPYIWCSFIQTSSYNYLKT